MSSLTSMIRGTVRFGRESEFQQEVSSLLSATRGGPVTCHSIEGSEEGRPLMGFVIGSGPRRVSLIAGSHSDEPVGPETLRALVRGFITSPEAYVEYLEAYTFVVIAHVNPDGETRNAGWMASWPKLEAYLAHVFREPPGRDIEFGYPKMRKENAAVARFLAERGPFDLHISLHGMAFSDGALLLIEPHWTDRVTELTRRFVDLANDNGYRLHDHDRGGDKGFAYLGPGFSTTPRGEAMRAHFLAAGDPETAERFHDSSMEYVRSLGGDPLCLVTELPLFLITERPDNEPPGVPETYLRLKDALLQAKLAASNGRPTGPFLDEFGLKPIPVSQAMRMQMDVIEIALETINVQDTRQSPP